jgi:proteasome lid subunit RPN8/RPN11
MMITCPLGAIDGTLALLREAGQLEKECVVLWLGKRRGSEIAVADWYLPIQEAEVDYFRIPPEGMAALQAKLRSDRLMVAAQIHSHPNRAFHSEADDEWAIVRHLGALSLVVPRFASDTFTHNFLQQTKVYQFSSEATWDEVPSALVTETCLQII